MRVNARYAVEVFAQASRIVGGIVFDSSIVAGADVGDIRATYRVHRDEALGPASALAILRGGGTPCGSGAASGDVSTTDRRGLPILRKSSQAD